MAANRVSAGIEVEGLRELNRVVSKAVDRDLPKRIGAANREIGKLVISKLRPPPVPAAVGAGGGASVRPSATRRAVVLRVGGAHRPKPPLSVWGRRRVVRPGVAAPPRPFIKGTAETHRDEIEQAYLEAIADAMRPAFHDVEV